MGFFSATAAGLAALAALFPNPVAADKPYHLDLESYQAGDIGKAPVQEFHSSNVKAAIYQINYWDPSKVDTDSPYMFMAGKYGKWGPSIVSSKDLSLIWADQNYDGLAQVARTWDNWRGRRVMSAYSDGRVRVYDESYNQLYVYDGRGDLQGVTPDSHEAALTHDGNILMFLCPAKDADLSELGGRKDGKIADCTVQEVNPESGEVIFQWATSEYFAPSDSVWPMSQGDVWDYCHMNAVEKTEEGNYLISYRQLSCVIMVDGKTREVLWVMWGKKNMFQDVTEGNTTAEFAFQHEARVSGKNRLTLFDNHRGANNGFCDLNGGPCSRGLEVEYDPVKKTVWVVNEWKHPQSLITASRGGTQRTRKGNVVVAWGQNPMYTEYTADGELAMDIQRGQVIYMEHGILDVITYRIWKGDWVGKPSWGPNISCAPDETGRSLFVSWNGATEVDKWVLLMSNSTEDLDGADKVAAQSPRNGFETAFKLNKYLDYARIAAIAKDGSIIGSTPAVNTHSRQLIELDYPIKEVMPVGANSIASSVPSSAAVSIPTIGVEQTESNEQDGETQGSVSKPSESSKEDASTKKTVSAGAVLGVVVICVIAVIGVAMVLRWRAQRKQTARTKGEAAYGLLRTDGRDGRSSYEFDEDETSSKRTA